MERRFAVHAGAYRQALSIAIAIAVSGTSAHAAPQGHDARAQFDRGVAAYQSGDFATAAEAFGRSNALENDLETPFAWAQAGLKPSHCDKAVELYGKLLAMDLPVENKNTMNPLSRVQADPCHAKTKASDRATETHRTCATQGGRAVTGAGPARRLRAQVLVSRSRRRWARRNRRGRNLGRHRHADFRPLGRSIESRPP